MEASYINGVEFVFFIYISTRLNLNFTFKEIFFYCQEIKIIVISGRVSFICADWFEEEGARKLI